MLDQRLGQPLEDAVGIDQIFGLLVVGLELIELLVGNGCLVLLMVSSVRATASLMSLLHKNSDTLP